MINVWLLFVATVVGKSHEEYDSGNLSLFYFFYMWICIKGSLGGGDYWGGVLPHFPVYMYMCLLNVQIKHHKYFPFF